MKRWQSIAVLGLLLLTAAHAEVSGDASVVVFAAQTDLAESTQRPQLSLKMSHSGESWRFAAELDSGLARQRDHWLLREAYASFSATQELTLLAGRKLSAVGIFDFYSPLDILAPRNFQRHSINDEKRRLGTDQLSASWTVSDGLKLKWLWLPYRESVILPRNYVDSLAALNLDRQMLLPEREQRGQQVMQLQWNGSGFDGALFAFNGNSALPVAVADTRGRWQGILPRQQMLGGNIALSAVGLLWKAEAAYTSSDAFSMLGVREGRDMATEWMGGIELELANDSYLTLEGWYRQTRYADRGSTPLAALTTRIARAQRNQAEDRQTTVFSNFRQRQDGDRLKWEVGGGYDLTAHSYFLRARCEYLLDDVFRLGVKYESYHGKEDKLFGMLRYDSGLTLEANYFF